MNAWHLDTSEVMPFAKVSGKCLYPLSHYILTRNLSGASDQPLSLFSSPLLTPSSVSLIHARIYARMYMCAWVCFGRLFKPFFFSLKKSPVTEVARPSCLSSVSHEPGGLTDRGGQNSLCWFSVFSAPVSRAGLTCGEGLLGRVARHVHPSGDKGHLILGIRLQVPNGILVLLMCEVNGGAVSRHVLDAIGELDAINLSQGLEPGDQGCGVCDVSHLDLAGGIQACDQQENSSFRGQGQEQGLSIGWGVLCSRPW